jgi:hypothetical protein
LRMIDNSRTDNPYFNGNTDIIWEKAHDCAISCVMTCPTVDAVEVVHGRWVRARKPVTQNMECSVCHKEYLWSDHNYCPNCGADMRGETE